MDQTIFSFLNLLKAIRKYVPTAGMQCKNFVRTNIVSNLTRLLKSCLLNSLCISACGFKSFLTRNPS